MPVADTFQANADPESDDGTFSLSEARTIVGEFFTPNPWIYWTDFLLCWAVGIACFYLFEFTDVVVVEQMGLDAAWRWPVWTGAFLISAILFYRCVLFIHELMHIRATEFTAFRFVWNMLCGIPFLVPSFVYYTHIDHHRRKHYATKQDGEYIPLASLPAREILFYLSQVLVIPLLAVIRFGLLTPLTWFIPSLRRWVHRHASSLIMDPMYIRPLPSKRVLQTMRLQEVLCFLWIWSIAIRLFYPMGLLPGKLSPEVFLPHVYAMGVFILTLNALRTLAAHRWMGTGEEMTFVEQLADSINFPGKPWSGGLWAPVGLRFHALHHVFPTLPYHALPVAHERLMRELPVDSPYRQTVADSLFRELMVLWKKARKNSTTL